MLSRRYTQLFDLVDSDQLPGHLLRKLPVGGSSSSLQQDEISFFLLERTLILAASHTYRQRRMKDMR